MLHLHNEFQSGGLQLIYSVARRVWRTLPTGFRSWAGPSVQTLAVYAHRPPGPFSPETIRRGDVLVSGFFSDVNGIGRAGRLTLDAVETWGSRVLRHDLRLDPRGTSLARQRDRKGIWICHCNAPEALSFMLSDTGNIWSNRYRIGYWVYELPRLPADWHPALALFNEIWAPSQFVADAIIRARNRFGPIVRVVPHPLPDASRIAPDRSGFSISNAFTFLTMFDTRSASARKNPLGAIKAFQQAFDRNDQSVALIVKVVDEEADKAAVKVLMSQMANWSNIRIMRERLSDRRALELIRSVDCLVSLHRAEGFGLPVAEAMALGTPAIVTGWSGTREFSEGAAIQVPFRLVPVEDPSGRYVNTAERWAEPDLDAAADAMRLIAGDDQTRERLSVAGLRLAAERLGSRISAEPYRPFLEPKMAMAELSG